MSDFPDLAHQEPPDLSADPEWTDAPVLGIYRPERSFVSGDPEGPRIRVRYFVHAEDGRYVGKVWFGPLAEGPPLCAHGGSLAAVLDDAMGRAAWVAGHTVLAGRIAIDFRKKCRLGEVHRIDTRIVEDGERKVRVVATLLCPAGELVAEGEGIFVKISAAYFEEEKRRLEAMGIRIESPTTDQAKS